MKPLYFTTFILHFFVYSTTAQVYTQYFDGADTIFDNSVNVELDTSNSNIWQIGASQKIIFDSAATVPNAIVTDTINSYPVNNVSRFTIKIHNQIQIGRAHV